MADTNELLQSNLETFKRISDENENVEHLTWHGVAATNEKHGPALSFFFSNLIQERKIN